MVKRIVDSSPLDNGSSVVAPDVYMRDGYSKLTITINPARQEFGSLDRFIIVTGLIYKLLKSLKHANYYMYPELSGKGRIHYHGWLEIHDVPQFYLMDVPRLIEHGHIKIDTHDGTDKWDIYITKSTGYMNDLTNTNIHFNQSGLMTVLNCVK